MLLVIIKSELILSDVVCCRCHWKCMHQEGGGIAQAWTTIGPYVIRHQMVQ